MAHLMVRHRKKEVYSCREYKGTDKYKVTIVFEVSSFVGNPVLPNMWQDSKIKLIHVRKMLEKFIFFQTFFRI